MKTQTQRLDENVVLGILIFLYFSPKYYDSTAKVRIGFFGLIDKNDPVSNVFQTYKSEWPNSK